MSLDKLTHILLQTAPDLDAENIADIIWLALKLDKTEHTNNEQQLNNGDDLSQDKRQQKSSEGTSDNHSKNTIELKKTIHKGEKDEIPIHADNPILGNKKSIQGTPLRVPMERMLIHPLQLIRGLRPLHRKVNSTKRYEVDVNLTVDFIAKQGIYCPVTKGAEERWLDLTMVIDTSTSMTPWKQTLNEFKRLMEYSGIFRKIKNWYLYSDNENVCIKNNKDTNSNSDPRQIIENNRRQIIFVLSDCISPAWYSGSILNIILDWQKKAPVSIIQMLPQRLWQGTSLRIADNVNFKSNQPLALNKQLIEEDRENDDQQPDLQIPVITIDKISLTSISNILTGKVDSWVTGVSFESINNVRSTKIEERIEFQDITAKQRVERFFKQATPLAQKLAGYFAAIPLNISVMRIVQQTQLPESNQTHFAEVFLSGLIKTKNNPLDSRIEYDFYEGVRNFLLDTISNSEAFSVLEKNSNYITQQLGSPLDFKAILASNAIYDDNQYSYDELEFAQISQNILERNGIATSYFKLADANFDKRKWKNIPTEIKGQGAKDVNDYQETKKQQKKLRTINFVRAFFIGYGGAGKTTLINTIIGEQIIKGEEKMTPGIDIREWIVGSTDTTAEFWDFGGQVIAHATYQFFFRELCLYVLVLDSSVEDNANEQAEYWLQQVNAFGKAAPIMLVGNKSDLTQINLNIPSLLKKYPNIIGFYPLSCNQHKGVFQPHFDTFKVDLVDQLQKLGSQQFYFTEQQFAVMQALRARARHSTLIELEDFESLCAEYQVTTEGEQSLDWLLDLLDKLDKLGVVIYFPELARLGSIILNPNWLTYGIYTLLYSKEAQASLGVLSEATVINILKTKLVAATVINVLTAKQVDDEQGNILDYSVDKCGFIINVMEEFKLCFRLPVDRKQIIIPDLLPLDQPEHGFDKKQKGTLAFEFEFSGFLPRHVMPAFIVSRYDEIKDNTCWRQGVLLQSYLYASDALVQVDYHQRTLSLWLQGKQTNRYFTELRDEIISILKRMNNLQYQEWLWLADDMLVEQYNNNQFGFDLKKSPRQPKVAIKQLLALEAAGKTHYKTEDGVYLLSKVLQNMPEKFRENNFSQSDSVEALKKSLQAVKIFISYAHEDENHKDDLVITLKAIQREHPKLEWWDDSKLKGGDIWKKKILSELDQADIVILLISPYYIASSYTFNVEMEKALLKYENKGHNVIPIIISEAPGWDKHKIGQLQTLPRGAKPLYEWQNSDRFWGDVHRGLKREIERLLMEE